MADKDGNQKSAKDAAFGCPVCGFTSDSAEEIRKHMEKMADDPAHQEYEMKEETEEENVGKPV